MELIWLIPLLPGIGAALNGVFGVRYFSKQTAAGIACATMGGALLLSIVAFVELLGAEHREHLVTLAQWIPPIALETVSGIGTFEVPWAFRLDPLSGMMILIVTGIGLLIHVYSVAYMDHEPRGGYARFFCYLNLFCFFMLTLVLGSNLLVMFVGWEGVGLCSYLLIGFWYHKQSASDAGKKRSSSTGSATSGSSSASSSSSSRSGRWTSARWPRRRPGCPSKPAPSASCR